MGNIERCDKCGSPSCCAHWRARATTGYDFVSLQRDEMRAERDAAREQLREAVEALREIVRHADMPAGESWERSYREVTWIAQVALADASTTTSATNGIACTCQVCGKFALDEDDIEALKQPARINAAFAGRKSGELADAREQLRGAVEERDRLRAALEFYAEEDSEFDAGGVDGGRRALEALGLPLGGQ